MILSIETLYSSPTSLATGGSHAAAFAGRTQERGPASMDDLVAMCRELGVGTGLLRACQRDAADRPEGPGSFVTVPFFVAPVQHERNAQCREPNGCWV